MTVEDETSGNDDPSQVAVEALQRIGWLKKAPSGSAVANWEISACILRSVLSAHREGYVFSWGQRQYVLTQRGVDGLGKLVAAGITLRTEICQWQEVVDEWIGPRLYLSHAANFSPAAKYTAIVSSRMGRGKRRIPDWPERVDAALASSHRLAHRLLSIPGMATHDVVMSAASTAGSTAVELDIAPDISPPQWMSEQLVGALLPGSFGTTISISPPLSMPASETPFNSNLKKTPLRDRAVIALADRVLGLSARRGGAIETLLRIRGSDGRFPAGTTYVAIRPFQSEATAHCDAAELLDDGVIGWLVEKRAVQSLGRFWSCRSVPAVAQASMQVAMPMPGNWRKLNADNWPFLAHCTRGTAGPRPLESEDAFLRRCWVDGTVDSHPLLTLGEILADEILRCNNVLYRNDRPVVSFSQVPLPCLLDRRRFQPHLGRWDWEPYGMVIRRSALERLGARPVIYGDEATFDSLGTSDQAFFQPAKRRSTQQDWSNEKEWRVPGDVRLGDLKHDDALIFVARRQEALALSTKTRWPVVWTRD